MIEPAAADVDVGALHHGYLRELRRRGGALLLNHPVDGLQRNDNLWTLVSAGSTYRAPIVVNAAGAWADGVAAMAGAAPLGLKPLRRTALLIDPPAGQDIRDWPVIIDVAEQFYFKPEAGLLMLSPADETLSVPCDAQPEEWDVAQTVERIERITTLEIARIRHQWAGLRTFSADRVPVIGFDAEVPGFFWLAGQGGYGIQTCPAAAQAALALIHERPLPEALSKAGVAAADLAPSRFRKEHT